MWMQIASRISVAVGLGFEVSSFLFGEKKYVGRREIDVSCAQLLNTPVADEMWRFLFLISFFDCVISVKLEMESESPIAW